jgi:hypothetical protein
VGVRARGLASQTCPTCGQVDHQIPGYDHGAGGSWGMRFRPLACPCRNGAPHQRTEAGEELERVEWLGQIGIRVLLSGLYGMDDGPPSVRSHRRRGRCRQVEADDRVVGDVAAGAADGDRGALPVGRALLNRARARTVAGRAPGIELGGENGGCQCGGHGRQTPSSCTPITAASAIPSPAIPPCSW